MRRESLVERRGVVHLTGGQVLPVAWRGSREARPRHRQPRERRRRAGVQRRARNLPLERTQQRHVLPHGF